MIVMDADGRVLAPSFRATGNVPVVSGRAFGRLLCFNLEGGGAMMVRADLAPHFSPIPPHGGHQDWWIAAQVARVADVHAIPQPVNRYRLHGANANLGADAARQLRLFEKELPFRRLGAPDARAGPRGWETRSPARWMSSIRWSKRCHALTGGP